MEARWSLLAALSVGACGGDAPPAATDAGPPPMEAPPPLPSVRLLVDTNRNGVLESRPDFADHGAWTPAHGAVFMANVDDDDRDHAVDALDDAVNGDNDALDLARVRVEPWPEAPTGAVGRLALSEGAAATVKLYRRTDGGWARWDFAAGTLSDAELRAGVEFGIEATDFATQRWDGMAELSLTVTRGDAAADAAPLGTDRVALKVAPWVIMNPLEEAYRVFVVDAQRYRPVRLFVNDLDAATQADGMELFRIDGLNPMYRSASDRLMGPDVWAQDIMEFGWTGIPGPDGTLHAMPVVLRTPPTMRAIGRFTEQELLGPDFGYTWKHTTRTANGAGWDPSLDSFGNLEIAPPHRTPTRDYPLGRTLYGTAERRFPDRDLQGFLDAQGVQGPPVHLDTSWLHVGHIDEFLSFVPAPSPRGWRMLLASPRLARELLEGIVRENPAHANTLMFEGQSFFYLTGAMEGQPYPAQRTIASLLRDEALNAFNQRVQARIDAQREILQRELGVADDEITEVPFLWSNIERNLAGALMPGTVNLLVYNRSVVLPRPHGAFLRDTDFFEDDMIARLSPLGLTVHFAEQWDILHAAEGEVHCGTNALRRIPLQSRWWEVAP